MKRKSILGIELAMAVLAGLGTVVYAQDKYALTSSSGIAFSDFRGYEDWPVVSSARTDEVLKVIVANPTMIEAYKAGVPGNGQPFPDPGWLQDREAPVEAEEEPGGPVRRGCARRLHAGFRHREGQQEISDERRVGIRAVQLRSHIRQVHGRSEPLGLRTRVPCGREGEGPHLPPVPEALNRADSRVGRPITAVATVSAPVEAPNELQPVRCGSTAGATHEIMPPVETACTHHSRQPVCDAPAC